MSIPWSVLLGGEPAEFAMGHEPSTNDVKATVPEAVSRADAGSEARAAGLGGGRARSGRDKAVRWRRVDLRAEVTRRFGAKVHASTAGEWLHRPGPTRPQPRPCHPRRDLAAQEAYEKTSLRC
ncbi:MAG: winged helix-turn-helix domain-containing protein [Acetobacteraceae bacterium]|nr:winged helix-turn-helix domain-containing protein [Acetobacteraceae bacterium]